MKTLARVGLIGITVALPLMVSADEQIAGTKNDEDWNATLTAVNAEHGSITAKSWFITRTFRTGDNCAITALDKKHATLSDLCPGEKVKIRYQNVEGVLVADRITEKGLRYSGTVEAVDPNTSTLTLENRVNSKAPPHHKSWSVASDCKVVLHDGKTGTISDVKPGDMVTLIYELPYGSAVVYRIRDESSIFTGTIDAIDLLDRTVKAKEMFGEKKFDLAKHCQIIVNGRENGDMRDLVLGQQYRFTYEGVNGVNVVNRITPTQETKPAETAATR